MNQVIINNGIVYMTHEMYDKFKNEQLNFSDTISGLPIQVIPDSYFG